MESVIKTFKKSGSITAANDILKAVGDGVKTDIPIDNVAALYTNYHAAMDNVKTYHMQDLDATIEGVSFQIATPKEINRISKLIRTQLGLKTKTVTNAETRMYNEQTTYDGYTNVNFVLPNGASYNSPGSGTSSSSTSSSYGTSSYGTSSYGTSSYGTGTTGSAFGY
ncbi:transcriptional regulator, partial [Limosilactobacillus fermentum]|nr:transcriptional regulator [Limosilactobacillus fermentum]